MTSNNTNTSGKSSSAASVNTSGNTSSNSQVNATQQGARGRTSNNKTK